MKKRDPDTYLIVPAGIFGRLITAAWTIFKWILLLTCIAVVGYILLQVASVLSGTPRHRVPAALHHQSPITAE